MLLSTAGLFLLGSLQPVLGKTFETKTCNTLQLNASSDQVVLRYTAQNTGCSPDVKTWVGIWRADAPLTSPSKAWKYLEDANEFRFSRSDLGAGEWKAGFLCEDGRRIPFLLSDNFELEGQCVYEFPKNAPLRTASCETIVVELCPACGFDDRCDACHECEKQCGKTFSDL